MLTSLNIKNFGLIDEVNLDFHESLNVFTGQTGAGKSILLEGVRVALGGRFTATQIRDVQQPSMVEAVFDLTGREMQKDPLIQEYLLDEDAQLILLRTYDSKGRSKIKINGMSVTVGQLKKVGSLLLDFHGAHDHQMLLSQNSHLKMLDRLIDFKDGKQNYEAAYHIYQQLVEQQEQFSAMTQNKERELDLLTHQVQELEQVSLDHDEYNGMMQAQQKINNAEKLYQYAQELSQILEDQPGSCLEQLRKLFAPMRQLNETDEKTESLASLLNQFQELGDEFAYQLREYADSLSFDAQDAIEVNHTADIYHDLLRKYGANLEEVQTYYEKTRQKYETLLHFDSNQDELSAKIKKQTKELALLAKDLTAKRKKAATFLKKTIEKELSELGIEYVRFEVRFDAQDFAKTGADQATFYISPNAGVDLKPLSEIVSSGEAARVMLALKKALIKVDPVPVLIFDEIDAQIGGRLGRITGEKLRDIARYRQVLLITHLPQIASFANHHYRVLKTVNQKRATTLCTLLQEDERIDELAQMMGSTRLSSKHAEEMLLNAGS